MKNRVLLINIDSRLPNIALNKIAMWHNQRGDEVIWDLPMMLNSVEKVYASCLFTRNRQKVENYLGLCPTLEAGGIGYDFKKWLPDEIEAMKPRINYGFTTRGCIRNCPWCFVPKAEGYIRVVGDIYDLWDGKSKSVTLLDNNILALPEHFTEMCQELQAVGLSVDFNQGLDIRLVDDKVCRLLKQLKFKNELRFSFDQPELTPIIKEKVKLLNKHEIRKHYFFHVLVGFNTTFEEDLDRLYLLKALDCRAYVMRHQNTPREKRYQRLAQWSNQFWTFMKYSFEDFCKAYELSRRKLT